MSKVYKINDPNDFDSMSSETLKEMIIKMNKGDAQFEINLNESAKDEEDSDDEDLDHGNFKEFHKLDLNDEDTYEIGEAFEVLEEKMFPLTEDGEVKKRIIRKGAGEPIPYASKVTIHYNAYLEFSPEPFDSTYVRKKPHEFIVGKGYAIPGLDLAVQSMCVNERAQFLIEPSYAYGEIGCPPRIPAKSTVLFEVELVSFLDVGAANDFENLTEEQQRNFDEIYKSAEAYKQQGNRLFQDKKWKAAVKAYNTAIGKLEFAQMRDYEDQDKQQKLLLSLYTNNAIALTKLSDVANAKKACINCNKCYDIAHRAKLPIPVKVFFNHAKCLMIFGDLDQAERRLKQAAEREPKNQETVNEMIELNKLKKEKRGRDLKMGRGLVRAAEQPVSKDFQEAVKALCKELISSKDETQMDVPGGLEPSEVEFVKAQAARMNLSYRFQDNKMYVCKNEAH